MNYPEFLKHVKTGDTVAVFKSRDWIGKLIHLVTGDARVHCGIVFLQEDEAFVAEMDGKKNVIIPLSQYDDSRMELYPCPVEAGVREVKSSIWKLLGERKSYNWADIVRIGFGLIFRWAKIMPKVRGNQKMICTEFNERVYRELGWKAPFDDYVVWPGKFCDALGPAKAHYQPE